jgi:signal transduction histidine kinase
MPHSSVFHILVIDDDPDTRANLRDILELDGYQVDGVGTVAETLRRQNWAQYAAILLDRKLPDGRAEELLPKLRQLAPQAAVLIVTGFADLDGAINAIRQGATDYLLKPINVDLLRTSLARVAERQRLAAELQEAQQRALQAERLAAIGEVYTGLAHESRNALQRSQACLERLAKRVRDRPEALDLIARIQRAQDHLHHLYEEVRTYAAPLNHLKRQRCDLRQLLHESWADLAVQRKNRRAELVAEAAGFDLHCWVDPHRMEQVFRNILENALSAGLDPVEIRVEWAETDLDGRPAVRVAIRDNGPGLTPEARQRIFEPFYTTKTKGTGLGMAITKRLVEVHGGRIAVGNPPGPGAEIVVIMPRGNP